MDMITLLVIILVSCSGFFVAFAFSFGQSYGGRCGLRTFSVADGIYPCSMYFIAQLMSVLQGLTI